MDKTTELVVYAFINETQKAITLFKEHSFSNTYHVLVDEDYQGIVVKHKGIWKVHPHEQSQLRGINHDFIIEAIIEAEMPVK